MALTNAAVGSFGDRSQTDMELDLILRPLSSTLFEGRVGILLLLAVGYIIARIIYRQFLHPLAKFPGPVGAGWTDAWWFYHLFSGRVTWRNHNWHKRYGTVVRTAPNHLSFNSPEAIKDCYGFGKANQSLCLKDPEFFLESVYGSWNIINENNKDEHARMRKMLSHAFSTKALLEQEFVLTKSVDDFMYHIGTIKAKAERLELISQSGSIMSPLTSWEVWLLGIHLGPEWAIMDRNLVDDKYDWVGVVIDSAFINDVMRCTTLVPYLPEFLDWWIPKRYQESSYAHMDYSIMETRARIEKQTEPERTKDFLHYMLNFAGPKATEKEMASHINALMMAGVITTSTFLSGVMYYLMSNAEAFDRLKTELRTTFSSLEEITCNSTAQCEYLAAVIKEGLRIYPPAGGAHLPRIVPPEGAMISGYWVPGRTRVSVHQWSVVHDEKYFHRPDDFIPERWIKGEKASEMGDRLEASQPLSYGPRGCLGKNLAALEMRLILAQMIWKYDVEWLNPSVDWERDNQGYRPELGVLFHERVAGIVLR
ncbi:hypothetical protein VF21_08607 [Pseudogymnoascus sp. 05NY08]|nr:hypothetical protein VF21_08607 [Pseudogymnoascus sp. 05NY08]